MLKDGHVRSCRFEWYNVVHIYIYYVSMLIFTAVIVQYKKMHGIGTCTRVFLKCVYEHLVLCIDVINSNGACLSEPSYWFLLGTLQGDNISHLWKKTTSTRKLFLLGCVCSLEGKTWVFVEVISYRLSFLLKFSDMM